MVVATVQDLQLQSFVAAKCIFVPVTVPSAATTAGLKLYARTERIFSFDKIVRRDKTDSLLLQLQSCTELAVVKTIYDINASNLLFCNFKHLSFTETGAKLVVANLILFFSFLFSSSFIPCGKFGSSYPSKAIAQPQEQRYPFLYNACNVFVCLNKCMAASAWDH